MGSGIIVLGSFHDDAYGALVKPALDVGMLTGDVYVVVPDPDAHYARAKAAGAEIVFEIEDKAYGRPRLRRARPPKSSSGAFGTYDPWRRTGRPEPVVPARARHEEELFA